MTLSVADISIAVQVVDQRVKLALESHLAGRLQVTLPVTVEKLRELRQGLGTGLRNLVQAIAESGRTVKEPAVAARAMRHLWAVGAELGFGMLRRQAADLEQYFRCAWPGWAKFGQPGYVPPLVELVGAMEHPLPLEFVPLFSTMEPDGFDERNLLSVAARFPVFSTIFFRTPADRTPNRSAALIENAGDLLIRVFLHVGLQGALLEQTFLGAVAGAKVRGPWPDATVEADNFVRELVEQLKHATHASDVAQPGQRDHIQHFVCHCDTDKPLSRDYTLTLAHAVRHLGLLKSTCEQSATLAELQAKLFGHTPAWPGPLVFLNACGSSKVTPEGVASFPGLFLDIGSRGVIGTEVAVPDVAAASFAGLFYTNLLQGRSLGEALYEARSGLLRDALNPIGALYAAYADPDLRLRRPTLGLKAATA